LRIGSWGKEKDLLSQQDQEESGLVFLKNSFFLFFVIVALGVHCDIYKSSYNVSELNSPLNYYPSSLPFLQ
jgi:hypothetical protein